MLPQQPDFDKNRAALVSLLTAAKDGDSVALFAIAAQLAASDDVTQTSVLSGYKDASGRCCFHFAASFGHTKLCELIADAGVSVNVADDDGMTPLHVAVMSNSVETVVLLLDRGADCNAATSKGETPTHIAARMEFVECLNELLSRGARVDSMSEAGTPLIVAAADGSFRSLELLLARGADVNAAAPTGMTALIGAASQGYPKCAKLLASAGADVAARGPVGLNALHWAAERGSVAMVTDLLSGAKATAAAQAPNDDGVLPIHLAAGNQHADVVAMLWPLSNITDVPNPEALVVQQMERVAREASTMRASGAGDVTEVAWQLPAEASEADKVLADEAKQRGNAAFAAKNFEEALREYTTCVSLDPRNHVHWSNRSAAHCELKDFTKALDDGLMCKRLAPTWPKAFFRIGKAYMGLEQYIDAATALYEGAQVEPRGETTLMQMFEQAVALGRKQHQAALAAQQ